jgi:hypothetical protein
MHSIPKDHAWLARWFGDDLKAGRIADPCDVRDVWPENYSTNSVQKVWAAKFAARHPNIAVLDLSSFKCGHDAPTYGLIDAIIKASGTPYAALHDIDANKPTGSMKIRVKTYLHTLTRHVEALEDRASRVGELDRRVAAKRRELMRARRDALLGQARRDLQARKRLVEMGRAFEAYLDEEESVLGMRACDFDQGEFPALPPGHRSQEDVAPLPPQQKLVQFATQPKWRSLPVGGGIAVGAGAQAPQVDASR